ncbi:MAG: PrgI family protein, partial [Candidatus Pacebacteria bacterium]|nr:PrgI family protein [Candidatus Paceibacterota bacterium]
EIKPKIAGPFTFHQLIWIGGPTLIILIMIASGVRLSKIILIGIPLMIFAVYFAFGKIRGFPVPTILARGFMYIFRTKIYVWQQRQVPPPSLPKKQAKKERKLPAPETSLRIAEGSRLKKLVNIIEIHR